MAYGSYANALTAIREVLDDGRGNLRTIPTTRFADTLHEGTSEQELARRGVGTTKPFRVRITGRRRHPASPPINSNVIIRTLGIEVVVSRSLSPREQLDSDTMATLEALAAEDADAIEQALGTPPNLRETAASGATGIVGDCARYIDHSRPLLTSVAARPPGSAQRYEVAHRLEFDIQINPATS